MTPQSAPLRPVYITTVACSVLGAAYALPGIPPSPLPVLFITLAPVVSVVLWVQNDARLHQLGTIQDWGLFVYLLWPVLVPWYVVKTRSRRAWTLALLLLVAPFAPLLVTLMAALVHDVAKHYLRV